ncbi:uncharacterized protein LOC131014262 [Salvia miltiorrhiza]|uniref:uncharacterized protein LOC131014262 n=1 Tax=Salvia miltiorrhiza TaxID=226208 RepID=UPI0025ACF3E1|nr:uncharacterized protein LOC131014262 [Salvia miltiorrhiza]
MRIRKHAKISPLLYATSSLKAGALLQTHVCLLNQSPWDVITFSPPPSPLPPPFQVNGIDVRAGNGSSEHCVSVSEREPSRGRLAEHHLSMVKTYSNVGARKPLKAKKAPATSNPYEFYYYSGFGPRWGKRRGNKNSSIIKNVEMQAAAIDFTEYEDDEEEARDNVNGKKRVRKPIKARSLKSLL